MYNHEPTNYVCPLCRIARGEETEKGTREERIIFKDELITACIAGKWWRSNPGHVVVFPNQHIENIYDMPEEIGHHIFDVSKQAAMGLKAAYGCDGTSFRQHNEPAGSQHVWHYHLHIFPRHEGDNLYLNDQNSYRPTPEEQKPYVNKLKNYFNSIKNSLRPQR
jgi:histidine triad (HIT) family protein